MHFGVVEKNFSQTVMRIARHAWSIFQPTREQYNILSIAIHMMEILTHSSLNQLFVFVLHNSEVYEGISLDVV